MELADMLQIQLLQQIRDVQNGSIMYMILASILMTVMTLFINIMKNLIPRIVEGIKNYYTEKANNVMASVEKKSILDSIISLDDKHMITEILFTRIYSSDEAMNEICDSVLNAVAQLHNIPVMRLIHNGDYIITYKDKPIQITDNLYFKIHEVYYNTLDPRILEMVKFSLYGNKISTTLIHKWIAKVYYEYKQSLENEFPNNLYYFELYSNEKVSSFDPRGDIDIDDTAYRRMAMMNAPKHLSFSKNEFVSNKFFESLYGETSKRVYRHVKFFVENEHWYKKQGLPYHLGMLFHGIPGCGKTACIKAIANYTNRHIINVNFRYIKTMTQFRNLLTTI